MPRRSTAAMVAADPSELYGKLDGLLRRARRRSHGDGLIERATRWVSREWTTSSPDRLVEATLVSGKLLLDGFDEGLELLFLAEEGGETVVSASAYAALMRVGLAEERHADVLALLARLQARGDPSSGALLCGMKAAAALGDWGAVARLFSMMSEEAEPRGGTEDEALDLEVSREPEWTEKRVAPPAGAITIEAYELALRAHCERGDVPRALGLVDSMRARGRPFPPSVYSQLALLARRTRAAGPLLAISAADMLATAREEAAPLLWAVGNQAGMVAARMGTVERAAVAACGGFMFVYVLVHLLGVGVAAPEVDPFAGW